MNQIKAHDMGILAMEWIDNDTLLTGSSDKSLKIWRIPEGKLSHESEVSGDWNFEKQICGVKVIGRNVLVLRLDGSIEFRDKINLKLSDDTKLLAGIGHSKGIVDVISSEDDNFLYSVSYDGNLKKWKREREQGDEKEKEKEQEKEHEKEHGHGHNNSSQLQHQSPPLNFENEIIFSCKNVQKLKAENVTISENKIIFENGEMIEFKDFIVEYENGRVLTADGNLEQVNISDKSQTIKRQKLPNLSSKIQLASFKEDFDILCVYTDDLTLKFYYNNELKDSIEVTSKISAMAFNPGCTYLATADDQRRIKIYKKQQDQEQGGINWIKESCQWCNHSARIDTLLWLDEEIILSAGIDGNILAWSLDSNKIGPIQTIKLAHSSPINKLTKFGNDEFVSVGSSDACIKIWTLADRR
jgi:WD40 repeat protein